MKQEQRDFVSGMCQEIAPNVYCLKVGKGFDRSNVYFVRSGSSWVLIDTASPHFGRLIHKTSDALFGVDTRPASILLTHAHPDHAGSALDLAQLWNCHVYVHLGDIPLATTANIATVEKYANPIDRWIVLPLLRIMPQHRVEAMFAEGNLKEVVRTFDPCGSVPDLPDWQCVPTSGHTPGHIALFRPSDRVLIAGDALLTVNLNSIWGALLWGLGRPKPKVSRPPWYATSDWRVAKESASLLVQLEPRVLATGHGEPLSGGKLAQELHAFADRFRDPMPA